MKYLIMNIGCDDSTDTEIDLNDEEYKVLVDKLNSLESEE